MKIRNITNMKRISVLGKVKTDLFFHYLPLLFKKKLDLKHYLLLIQRFNTLLKSFKVNKFYKIGKKIKLDHSLPLFGSDNFYRYMDKFINFDNKLSCSTAVISITNDCSFKCKHCYQRFDIGSDVDIKLLVKMIRELMKQGVTNFFIEGGDPFIQFDRLVKVCETIGTNGEITINSTGDGITLEKLKNLKNCCNIHTIAFSMNSPINDDINFFMGQDYAWNTLKHGMKLCNIASIPASLNCCFHNGHYENGNFEYLMEIAKDLKISHVKLIHPKAAGAWLQGSFPEFESREIDYVKNLVKKYNRSRKYSRYPAVTAQVVEEDTEHYGCRAGGSDLIYINAKGDIQPCEFLNISFGNIAEEEFSVIYERMREEFKTPGTKWLCEAYSEKIYAEFKKGEILPLSVERTKHLYSNWNRGDATPLYYKIEKELIK